MRKAAWDQDKARELHAEGKTDAEIARAVGVTLAAVKSWRYKNGLPCNPDRARSAGGERDAAEREKQKGAGADG